MKAAVLTDDRPQLALADLPDPQPGPGEVVLRVSACGICGSDLHVASSLAPAGAVLGHEIAGVIEDLGAGVEGWSRGQAVTGRPFFGCGSCRHCERKRQDHCLSFQLAGFQRTGGFAEATVLRADELFALPVALPAAEQALVEPLAVARHTLRRAGLTPGERVVVLGGGPIGLAVLVWARALGAAQVVVSDPVASRRELALALGADVAVPPEAVAGVAGDPQVVVECSGRPGVVDQALQLVDVDGRVTVVGVCTQTDSYFPWWGLSKEVDVRFAMYYGRTDFTDTIDALDHGSIEPAAMVTATVSLGELTDTFPVLAREPGDGKTVVLP